MTHKSIPEATRKKSGIQNSLIRLSCGIEAAEDLIQDLAQAFEALYISNNAQNELSLIEESNYKTNLTTIA